MLQAGTQERYRELAAWAARWRAGRRCPVLGINGAQGSGKSTLARFLVDELAATHGLRALSVSLDDYYLERKSRLALARERHPLFATRGVPGTHDVALGIAQLQQLQSQRVGEQLRLPVFDKARDDRAPPGQWRVVEGPFDLILFEGWCVGTPPEDDDALVEPVNALEAGEDADGRWRRAVNEALRGPYARWFAALDGLVFLQVPDFDGVLRWRMQQEAETRARSGGGMEASQLRRFIAHYERLTRHALRTLPARADAVLTLQPDHAVAGLRWRGPAGQPGSPGRP